MQFIFIYARKELDNSSLLRCTFYLVIHQGALAQRSLLSGTLLV